jgi:hypothetical protein
VAAGTTSTLTATVNLTAYDQFKVGQVFFQDGQTTIGDAVPVSRSGGVDNHGVDNDHVGGGTHTLTAVLTQTDPYTPIPTSTSPGVTSVVTPATEAKATTTTLMVFPKPAFEGLPVIFLAQVTPSVTGRVQFRGGTTELGAPVPVTAEFAMFVTSLPRGAHSQTAVFTPTDNGAFATSTSAPVSLTVNPFV